ncbi:hypothetical protein P4O66_014097, partial [Electrophorus voltai]
MTHSTRTGIPQGEIASAINAVDQTGARLNTVTKTRCIDPYYSRPSVIVTECRIVIPKTRLGTMSKPSRLVRPSKQKESPGDRSRMLIVGERLMRAGSEGNLVRPRPHQEHRPPPSNAQEHALNMLTIQGRCPGVVPTVCAEVGVPDEPEDDHCARCSPEGAPPSHAGPAVSCMPCSPAGTPSVDAGQLRPAHSAHQRALSSLWRSIMAPPPAHRKALPSPLHPVPRTPLHSALRKTLRPAPRTSPPSPDPALGSPTAASLSSSPLTDGGTISGSSPPLHRDTPILAPPSPITVCAPDPAKWCRSGICFHYCSGVTRSEGVLDPEQPPGACLYPNSFPVWLCLFVLYIIGIKDTVKSGQWLCSPEDVEHLEKKPSNTTESIRSDPWSLCTLPWRHAIGGEHNSQDRLVMQPHNAERRREAFLEHLKQKYPHHASTIMSLADRIKEQNRCRNIHTDLAISTSRFLLDEQVLQTGGGSTAEESSRREQHMKPLVVVKPHCLWACSPTHISSLIQACSHKNANHKTCAEAVCVRGHVFQISGNPQHFGGKQGDQQSLASLESLQAMSEEVPSTFTRGSRTRASLPVVKSSNQTKDRSLGVLYLQYGEETRQALMPNEVTSADTVRALFVSAFPQQLTLKMLESPNVAIYIKDHVRNVYYELTDIRNITAHSCLKVYHKDPAQAFNHSPLNSNGDARLSRYSGRQQAGGQSMLHTLPPPHSPIHTVQGSMSPPSGRSMPPSPSRFPYGMAMPASATLPRDRLSSVPITRSAPPCSSAILERRDVKPDEDVSGRGAPLYADPYTLPEARLSVASSHGTQIGDMLDGQVFLQRRSQAKSVGSYAEVADPQHSLYRQRSRKYSESPHMPLGSKSPPSSPQRVGEVRMIDIHPGQNAHMLLQGAERTVHARRSFRKDSNGTMEAVARARGTVASPVFVDLPHGHGDRPFQGPISTEGPQSERMKAMEQQIASLTGLLQHALLKGTNTSGIKENASEKSSEPLAHGTTSGVHVVLGQMDSSEALFDRLLALQECPLLLDLRAPYSRPCLLRPGAWPSALSWTPSRGTSPAFACTCINSDRHRQATRCSDLLPASLTHPIGNQMVQNQEVVRVMLQQAEEELTDRVCEQLRLLDDPMQKQRKQVEQERHRYVSMEENLLLQLGELENHVERLKKDSAQQPITLRDVEEGAVNLRTVGECLAALKGEFPALQLKMRSVLRVEVEAVRFLKEEPHKMDSMLKRVKGLTETLSDLQSCATESHALVDPVAPVSLTTTKESDSPDTSRSSPGPQPLSPARSELTPSSPVVVHQACSSPVNLQPCQHSVSLSHQPSPPLTPVSGRDSPTVAKVSPRSREDSTALQKKEASAGQERPMDCSSVTSCPPQHEETGTGKDKVSHSEIRPLPSTPTMTVYHQLQVAEKEQAEQMEEAVGTEMERKLRQAQDSLMESIPNLEVTQEESSSPSPATCLPDKADSSCPPPPLPEAATLAEPADKPVKISVAGGQKPAIEKPLRVKPSPETASKSPPPPPPRRFHPPATGLTTGRSGEVIYATHKESIFVQQDGEEATPQAKLQRVPPEVKPKPHISTPIHASAAHDEGEGDKDKIVAELQVFEKSPVKNVEPRYVVDLTTHELPDKDLEAAFSLSSYDPKVIYYITGKSRPPSDNAPSGPGEQNQSSEGIISSLKVAVLNPSDPSPWPNILTSHDLTLDSSKQEKENQKETSDTEQMSACFVEALKDSCKAEDDTHVLAPKEELPEAVTDRLEEQVSSHASELPITVTEEPVKTCVVGEDQTDSQVLPGPPALSLENGLQEVVWSSSREQDRHTEQDRRTEQDNLIPDVPRETDSPDRFAFVITKTKVQALSTGEYQQLVSSKGQDVETVQVGADTTDSAPEDSGSGKKPVIIVFDEPMDIQQAYKRLSTIFECEEELDRMLSKERIDEEVEDAEEEDARSQMTREIMPIAEVAGQLRPERNPDANGNVNHLPVPGEQNKNTEDSTPQLEDGSKVEPNDMKQEGKKKFKFPFPKKQLAAIGQALRTGTKAGKKTLQVVVYEDEEEEDGTLKKAKEAKRFEITSTTDSAGAAPSANTAPAADTPSADAMSQNHTVSSQSPTRSTNEICKSTYKTLDSLEETIKQLETTISNMEPGLSPETSRKDPKSKRTAVQTAEGKGSPSKRPAPLGPKPQKPPQRKNSKALSVPHPPTPNSPGSADPKQVSTSQHRKFPFLESNHLAQSSSPSRERGKSWKTPKAPGLPEAVSTGSFTVGPLLGLFFEGHPVSWPA